MKVMGRRSQAGVRVNPSPSTGEGFSAPDLWGGVLRPMTQDLLLALLPKPFRQEPAFGRDRP